MVTNPNIGLKPVRQRGAEGRPAGFGGVPLPATGILREQTSRRRRRARLRLPQPPRLEMPARARVGAFSRAYILIGAVLAVGLLYLVQAAGATQASYEIGRLQAQQSDLLAEQDHLRYQEASRISPAQVETEAAAANLIRPRPYKYVQYSDSGVLLDVPGPAAPDQTPLWARALAAVGRKATGGSGDALAAGTGR
ncbi:MAG: hypothetical protein NVS9B1_07700 [Candidatus Dormibacteraceae bacterium]